MAPNCTETNVTPLQSIVITKHTCACNDTIAFFELNYQKLSLEPSMDDDVELNSRKEILGSFQSVYKTSVMANCKRKYKLARQERAITQAGS